MTKDQRRILAAFSGPFFDDFLAFGGGGVKIFSAFLTVSCVPVNGTSTFFARTRFLAFGSGSKTSNADLTSACAAALVCLVLCAFIGLSSLFQRVAIFQREPDSEKEIAFRNAECANHSFAPCKHSASRRLIVLYTQRFLDFCFLTFLFRHALGLPIRRELSP
jgi:hypothetical protein